MIAFAAAADGCTIGYRVDGPAGAPAIVFANSLGTTHAMWDAQADDLARRYRVVRYDSRGHGASGVPAGPYTIDVLADDVLAVLDAAGIERAAFCGLSLGGMVGQSLGVRHARRFTRLMLANTSAKMGSQSSWNERIAIASERGMAALRPGIIERWFTPEFRAAHPANVERFAAMLDATDRAGYAACCAAIRDMDQRAALASVRLPVTVIAGARDPATPPADGAFIAAHIPLARLVTLDAAHLSNVECAAEFTAIIEGELAAANG